MIYKEEEHIKTELIVYYKNYDCWLISKIKENNLKLWTCMFT